MGWKSLDKDYLQTESVLVKPEISVSEFKFVN